VIIFGGGMAQAGDQLLDCVRKYIKIKSWTVLSSEIDLRVAQSPNHGGILGAALAASRAYENRPDLFNMMRGYFGNKSNLFEIVTASKSKLFRTYGSGNYFLSKSLIYFAIGFAVGMGGGTSILLFQNSKLSKY